MSFLRWAGSKKQLGDILSDCWYAVQCSGGNGRYIEAFSGSASLFFRLRPNSAVLIDINKHLTECFDIVKTSPRKLFSLLSGYENSSSFYYEMRGKDIAKLTKIERSARFIYLNRYCFNGLYRTNSKGHFNVPYGGERAGLLPSLMTLIDASESLCNAEIVAGDFCAEIRTRLHRGDFVYLDPPYAKRNHSLDWQYGPDVFGVEDLKRLFDLLLWIEEKGAYFVFSYLDCEEIEIFVEKWGAHHMNVNRIIAANAGKRGKEKEVLITNL